MKILQKPSLPKDLPVAPREVGTESNLLTASPGSATYASSLFN